MVAWKDVLDKGRSIGEDLAVSEGVGILKRQSVERENLEVCGSGIDLGGCFGEGEDHWRRSKGVWEWC